MKIIPPELASAVLTALSVASAWFATWLARRGKREDNKISQAGQAFSQLRELAEARQAEIERLNAELASARAETERVRDSWEERWTRQMMRCRDVTDTLARSIEALRQKRGIAADREAKKAARVLQQHNEDDHEPSI